MVSLGALPLVLLVVLVGLPTVVGAFDIVGGSGDGSAVGARALVESGASHARVYLLWRYVEEEVTGPLDANVTVAALRAHPEAVTKWASEQRWDELDRRVGLLEGTHVTLIGEVGEGTVMGLPRYNGSYFDPNVVGPDLYLGYLYRSARATVARYQDRISFWQIENELNEAWLASVAGQRRFQFLGSIWKDWDFLTSVLATLRMAVKDQDPSALVTQNLHTDVAKWVHEVLFLKGYYEDAAKAWAPLLDVMSLDAYPNAVVAYPCESALVAARVQNVITASGGKRTFVMETSYPVNESNGDPSAPSANFTVSNQVACIRDTYAAVKATGGVGVMYFKFAPSTGIVPPPGGYDKDDLEALKLIQVVMSHNEDPLYLLEWLSGGLRLDYLEHRLPLLLRGLSDGFGVLYPNGTGRASFEELSSIFHEKN